MKNRDIILDYFNQINRLFTDIDNFAFPEFNEMKEQKEELSFRMIELTKLLETEEIAKIKSYLYSRTNLLYPNIYNILVKVEKNNSQRRIALKKEEDLIIDKLMFIEVLESLGFDKEFNPEIELLHRLNLEVKHNIENEIKKKK